MVRRLLFFIVVAGSTWCRADEPLPAIELIGTGAIAGNHPDRSNLSGKLEDGTPANRLGAWGSAIAYTGQDNLYAVLPDRGPNASNYKPAVDNTTSYPARVELLRILVDPVTRGITATLVDTRLLKDETGKSLSGLSTEYVADQPSDFQGNRRIDPEGLRVSCDGRHYYVSEEYGPGVFEFDTRSGLRTRVFSLPPRFAVLRPAATGAVELSENTSGRQANHGLEGLAITPDGHKLAVIMQGPLIQDSATDRLGRRRGINVRLLMIDLPSGQTQQYLYQLADGKSHGVNEIVAVNSHEFLVLERDGKSGTDAQFKSLFLIDVRGATDISHVDVLPGGAVPKQIHPVTKRLFVDLLDPVLGLAGPQMPGKIEGLAFGPALTDGRLLLLLSSDNDFRPAEPSRLFALAIKRSALGTYEPQQFATPAAEAK